MSRYRALIAPPGTPLTERELEVIDAYRKRGSIVAAGIYLGISESTVKEHLANARSRRRVRRTWQLLVNEHAA